MKLLISSVGSLVGQNILDVLEYPGASRRPLVEVVGTNSLPDSPNNFRCNRCYLIPETISADYAQSMASILLKEAPDLILCGRDDDTVALSQLKSSQPNLPGILPCAAPQVAAVCYDKWQTFLFAKRHALPVAETFMIGQSGDKADLLAFAQSVGYPLIAKPTDGYTSRGVLFVRGDEDLEVLARKSGTLFQEYLGDRAEPAAYCASLSGIPPLFIQCGDAGQHSCHTVISPDGEIAPMLMTQNRHAYGQTVRNVRVFDPALDAVAHAYARALAAEGGTGPVTIQCRQDSRGDWKMQELNLRTNGSTLARFLMGQDELYLIVRDFLPGRAFPEMRPNENDPVSTVYKSRYAFGIPDSGITALSNFGTWP